LLLDHAASWIAFEQTLLREPPHDQFASAFSSISIPTAWMPSSFRREQRSYRCQQTGQSTRHPPNHSLTKERAGPARCRMCDPVASVSHSGGRARPSNLFLVPPGAPDEYPVVLGNSGIVWQNHPAGCSSPEVCRRSKPRLPNRGRPGNSRGGVLPASHTRMKGIHARHGTRNRGPAIAFPGGLLARSATAGNNDATSRKAHKAAPPGEPVARSSATPGR